MKKIFFLLLGSSVTLLCLAQQPELVVQTGHNSSEISFVAFSPDGKLVITCGSGMDFSARLWDLYGRLLYVYEAQYSSDIECLAFSPDGRYIVSGSRDGGVRLWNLYGQQLAVIQEKGEEVTAVAFMPDSKKVVYGSKNGFVRMRDLSGMDLLKFRAYKNTVQSLSIAPNGQSILTGGWVKKGGAAKLWDLQGKLIRDYAAQQGVISTCSFSPDGKYILTGHWKGAVKVWSLSGKELPSPEQETSRITTATFSPDGQTILTSCEKGKAKLWKRSAVDGRKFELDRVISGGAEWACFSPDGRYLFTGGSYGMAGLWDLSGRLLQVVKGRVGREVVAVAVSPDGHHLAIADVLMKEVTLTLWDLRNGNQKKTTVGPFHCRIAFLPDKQALLTVDIRGKFKLWDFNLREISSFEPEDKSKFVAVQSLVVSPDGKMILTANDSLAVLMDFNGKIIRPFREKGARYIKAAAFSPDGQMVLVNAEDDKFILWNLQGEKIKTFRGEKKVYAFPSVAFSPDGKKIVISSWDHFEMRDLEGNLLRTFSKEDISALSAALSPSGDKIFLGGADGGVKLVDLQTETTILQFFYFPNSADGWVIATSEDYYMTAKKVADLIHFKTGLQTYLFEQFDLRLNRPDLVLKTLLPFGAADDRITTYHDAYLKRLEKYGFTEAMLSDDYHVPECAISNADQLPITSKEGTVKLQIEALDTLRLLDRLNVYVNDVPIYGIQGINLREENIQSYNSSLNIPLSRGPNKIQVSVLNQGGAESLKATAFVTYDAPKIKPNLYLLTIGVSDYQADGKNLQYAAKDAKDIAGLYQSAEGFGQVYTYTLTDGQVTKANILALRSWLEQSRVDDQVLLFVSGHGLIDDNYDFYYVTHDTDFSRPSENGILYDDIEGLLDGIPARKKLLLMDACHSGEFDAEAPPLTVEQQESLAQKGISFEGFTKGDDERGPTLGLQNSFEMMQQLFADLRRGSGATVITSSAGVQVSFEDEQWQNGAFTYAFLYGLKSMQADANGDGQVTASEIQAFVAEYVPRLTEGLQVPTFRRENLEFDFRVW